MRDNARSGALTEVTFFILLALYEPRHGYAVMQFVEEKTGGRLVLGAGSVSYTHLDVYKRQAVRRKRPQSSADRSAK